MWGLRHCDQSLVRTRWSTWHLFGVQCSCHERLRGLSHAWKQSGELDRSQLVYLPSQHWAIELVPERYYQAKLWLLHGIASLEQVRGQAPRVRALLPSFRSMHRSIANAYLWWCHNKVLPPWYLRNSWRCPLDRAGRDSKHLADDWGTLWHHQHTYNSESWTKLLCCRCQSQVPLPAATEQSQLDLQKLAWARNWLSSLVRKMTEKSD